MMEKFIFTKWLGENIYYLIFTFKMQKRNLFVFNFLCVEVMPKKNEVAPNLQGIFLTIALDALVQPLYSTLVEPSTLD